MKEPLLDRLLGKVFTIDEYPWPKLFVPGTTNQLKWKKLTIKWIRYKRSKRRHYGMNDLIDIMKVLHSVMIYDEMEFLKDPPYREARWNHIHTQSMSKHKDYLKRILPRHSAQDSLQDWMICLTVSLYRRLDSSNISLATANRIKASILPDTVDESLRLYRENVMKLMV